MKTSDYLVIALLVAVIVAVGFVVYGSQCGCRKKPGNMAHLAGKKRGGACGIG